MKSYGENFVNATLKLTVRIEEESEMNYEISGHHETRTSIHIPHKFELPGGGAKSGDTIFVDAELISGRYFKINGMALCIY